MLVLRDSRALSIMPSKPADAATLSYYPYNVKTFFRPLHLSQYGGRNVRTVPIAESDFELRERGIVRIYLCAQRVQNGDDLGSKGVNSISDASAVGGIESSCVVDVGGRGLDFAVQGLFAGGESESLLKETCD